MGLFIFILIKIKSNKNFSSSVSLTTFKNAQQLRVATAMMWESTDIEHFHRYRKFYWTLADIAYA